MYILCRYQNSPVASEKSTLLSSLSCTKNVWLLFDILLYLYILLYL